MSLRTVVSLGLVLTICAAPLLAQPKVVTQTQAMTQPKIKVSGTMTLTEGTVDSMSVSIGVTHMMSLERSTGTNAATGEAKFMDGAEAVNTSTSDLVMGNGPHHGYLVLTKNGSAVFCEWKGTVTTVAGEKEPLSSFAGTFTWTGGTGEFAKITGSGTYKGHFTSPTTYTADWTGEYSLGK
jgi:hypothetical protein